MPRQAKTRRKIIAVRLHQRCWKRAKHRPALSWQHWRRRRELRAHIQVCDAIVRLGVRAVVFVTQAKIQREIRTHSPIVLDKQVIRVGAKIIRIGSRLQTGLLRQSKQEIGEVVSGIRSSLRRAAGIITRRKSSKHEGAIGIPRRTETLQNAAIVRAKAPVVLGAIPRDGVRDGVSLVQLAAWRRIAQPSETRETEPRQSKVEWICRN